MSNRIDTLFATKKEKILSVYFTAGFPALNDTVDIIQSLQSAGCDMIEIGIPFSDPLADGPVIQHSGTIALANGITLSKILEQLKEIRKQVHIPLILMGYFNPLIQYGIEKFCAEAEAIGIDGLIIPDMPPDIYEAKYKTLFEKHGLHHIMLITPRTGEERIKYIEKLGSGFIYAVATSSTTGTAANNNIQQAAYFEKIKAMQLKLPVMAGFGIGNRDQFNFVCQYLQGGIIGTAFIKHLGRQAPLTTSIPQFIKSII